MRLETNIPLAFWAEMPELCHWAREALHAFEAKVPFQRTRNFALPANGNFPFLGSSLPYIEVNLDFHQKTTAFFSTTPASLLAIEDWLATQFASYPNYSNLEDLLYGRNRNPSAQNHGGPPLGANHRSGGAVPFPFTNPTGRAISATQGLAGASGTLSAQQMLAAMNTMMQNSFLFGSWDPISDTFIQEEPKFPLTERGEASLSEALSGALPLAERLEKASYEHRRMHNKMLKAIGRTDPNDWGTPPASPQLHIQQGEIIARRIWFTDGQKLTSIAQPTSWYPGDTISGDISRNGVFAFRNESLALPLLYCYIRDANQMLGNASEAQHRPHILSARAIILGTVKLWGDVVEHQYGYRASFAKIHSLDECSIPSLLPDLQRKYLPNSPTANDGDSHGHS